MASALGDVELFDLAVERREAYRTYSNPKLNLADLGYLLSLQNTRRVCPKSWRDTPFRLRPFNH